ncbi:MAG TPA: hypothetical protein VH137_08170, partial [Gemmatimonadales bacterium]|nr:hypothetical protein [Gemmatimonadales bacterium]
MTDPLALIVLVAAGEASNPTTIAMARATGDALGGVPVEVREIPGQPTDADALAAEKQSRADAVVELIWEDAERRRVTLRVHLVASQRWVERSIGFMPSDPAAERGRTLGFAAASIVPETTRGREEPANPSPPAPTTPSGSPGPSPAPSAGATVPLPAAPRAQASAVPNGATTAEATNLPRPTRRAHVEIDLLATGGLGITGNAEGAGGGGAVGWIATDTLTLRIGASERAGSLDAAQATLFTLLFDAGVTWHAWRPTRARRLGASLRADYLLVRQSATHFDSDDPSPVT